MKRKNNNNNTNNNSKSSKLQSDIATKFNVTKFNVISAPTTCAEDRGVNCDALNAETSADAH